MRKNILLVFCLLVILLVAVTPAISAQPVMPAPKYRKVVLIHYAKPPWAGPPQKEEEPKNYTAYALLGPKWLDLPVSYVIDPEGAPEGSVEQIFLAFEAWDDVTSEELFNDTYTVNSSVNPSTDAPDFVNTVSWRKIAPPKIVAMTIMWYVDNDGDGEPSEGDETVDCDIVLNAFHEWGIDPDGEGTTYTITVFDVRNIVTHEAGHVVGLDDLYDDVYSELTMYGYSEEGETKKISLEDGDKFGCIALYGE